MADQPNKNTTPVNINNHKTDVPKPDETIMNLDIENTLKKNAFEEPKKEEKTNEKKNFIKYYYIKSNTNVNKYVFGDFNIHICEMDS